MEEWMAVIGLEILFVLVSIAAAWAVMSHRVRTLEGRVDEHLTGSSAILDRLARVETKLDLLLEERRALYA